MHRDELILNEVVLGSVALRICAKLSQLQKKPITKVRHGVSKRSAPRGALHRMASPMPHVPVRSPLFLTWRASA